MDKYKKEHGKAEQPGSASEEAASSSKKQTDGEANKEQQAHTLDSKATGTAESSISDKAASKQSKKDKQKSKEASTSDKATSKEASISDKATSKHKSSILEKKSSKKQDKEAKTQSSEIPKKQVKSGSFEIHGFKAKSKEQLDKLKTFSTAPKKSKSVELLDDDNDDNPQPTEAPHEGSSSSSAPSSSAAPAASSGQKANMEAVGQDKARIVSIFDPKSDYKKEASERKTKDLYLQADLIFPGIALKKMKQAMTANDATPENYIAILGEHTLNMHRTAKRGVQKMVLADYVKYKDTFWTRVSQHLGSNNISVLIVAASFPVTFEEVAGLKDWLNSFDITHIGLFHVRVLYVSI